MNTTDTHHQLRLTEAQLQVQKRMLSPFWMPLFLLGKLPTGWWWGMRVHSVQDGVAVVRLPYGWRTQNPFRSIYFAAQSGAAELSTGIWALMATSDKTRPVSMLVTKVESEFFKKADTTTYFTCKDGAAIFGAVNKAIETGEGVVFTAVSEATNQAGVLVSRTRVTWSFKCK